MINYKFINNEKSHTLVCVHGFTQNQAVFDKQVDDFSDAFNCLLIDLRGHGGSEHSGPFGIVEYSADIVEVLSFLELNHFFYWGTHTGAAIGLHLYFEKIFQIKGLILEGAVIPGYNTPEIKKNIERAKDVFAKNGLDAAIEDWFLRSEWFDYMRKNPDKTRVAEHLKILQSFKGLPWKTTLLPEPLPDRVDQIPEIHVPILVYNGAYDMQEFFDMADLLSKNKNATKRVIPDAGGFPLWENPSVVNSVVKEWLQDHRPYFEQ